MFLVRRCYIKINQIILEFIAGVPLKNSKGCVNTRSYIRKLQYAKGSGKHLTRLLLLLFLLTGCSAKKRVIRHMDAAWDSPNIDRQFTGLLMVDLRSGDTLYTKNAKKAFTPASTIKLLTLYAALKTLPDRVTALKYTRRGDTLIVVGTGDPSALHHHLGDSTAYRFMKRARVLAMVNTNLQSQAYGPGWSWEDFDRAYMPSRSPFPIYGNVLRVIQGEERLSMEPANLRDSITLETAPFRRDKENNRFYVNPAPGDTLEIPLATRPDLERQFWASALGKPVHPGQFPEDSLRVLPGIPADTLYKRLMKESDNFVAEQLMLMVSGTLGDSLSFEKARDYTLEFLLPDLPQQPRWVDGSGLSRYNLVSPETLVHLLGKLYREVPEDRLFSILAAGGEGGTLQNYYKHQGEPYLFGKTGTLSNNHNLSGFLRTRSGKIICFAFMNNHYQQPTSQVAARMERILLWVRDHY